MTTQTIADQWDRVDSLLARVHSDPLALAEARSLLAEIRWQRGESSPIEKWAIETKDPYLATAKQAAPSSTKQIGKGFTGNLCTFCGSADMIRSGTCELCTRCGETTGCS